MAFGKMGAMFGRLGVANGNVRGGPFLLLADGVSRLLLANGTDRLLITNVAPTSPNSGQPVGLLLALTYP